MAVTAAIVSVPVRWDHTHRVKRIKQMYLIDAINCCRWMKRKDEGEKEQDRW